MSKDPVSRRDFFLKAAGLLSAAALLKTSRLLAEAPPADSQAATAPAKPLTFLTDKQAKKVSDPGDYEVFKLNDKKILFARVSADEVIAMSAVCTHEGCTVKYKAKEGDVKCWCHGSTYDLKGHVIKGPAQHDLTFYPVEIRDGKIGIAL